MKTRNILICAGVISGLVISCTSEKNDSAINKETTSANIVEVTALDFRFEAPDQIPAGWTTFLFKNEGVQEHFLYSYRLPENKTYAEYEEDVLNPFTDIWEKYASGELTRPEAEQMLGTEIADWYFTDVISTGGPALTEPGEVSRTTVKLEPGLYVMECYVKMPDGRWHTELGMVRPFTVTEDSTGAEPPKADLELTLTNYEITMSGKPSSGKQTIAVHVMENPEGFMKHDINLFRLDGDTTVEEIVKWMDWMDLEQFRAPAPGYSLGGVEHMNAGKTGYMTVDLGPGDYAWVSEGYGSLGMVKA
ncbi:MAG: hypothetical protein ACFCU6_08275, partial [Balneolaceae bacterium]